MKEFRADLHVHTVLSPCAEVEMIPPLIVQRALDQKIDIIAITDHNASANVRAVRPLGADTLQLHLQTPRSHRLRFLAGQSVTLGIAEGDAARAQLPIASCPCDDRNLHFFVDREAGDPLSSRLFGGALKVGDPDRKSVV